ncbi:MAG TPA: hypothetical protein VFI31_19565 [Pirellulales bacterium]|nr:hypothetical protein [Pirellulales bacterium]
MSSSHGYFETLGVDASRAWGRFWFTPTDPITLGVLRIAVGLMALYLVACYTPDLNRYFGDDGLLPVKLMSDLEQPTRNDLESVPPQIREAVPREFRLSYLDWIHDSNGLKAVHLAGLIVLLLFTLGLFTRLTAVASLVVFLSYLHRAPMLTCGTEPIVALLLFYLCIGPSGSACSLDARLAAKRRLDMSKVDEGFRVRKTPWATVAVRLIQVHLTLVYSMMALSKLANDSWWNGLGIWWLIAKPESRMIDLTALHQVPLLVNAWTYAVLLWQTLMPIMVWNRLLRPLMLGVNAVMWILLAPVIGNLPFAAVMIVASLAFVSPETIRRFLPRRTAAETAVPAHAVL